MRISAWVVKHLICFGPERQATKEALRVAGVGDIHIKRDWEDGSCYLQKRTDRGKGYKIMNSTEQAGRSKNRRNSQ